MSPQYSEALKRAVVSAFVVFLLTTLTVYQQGAYENPHRLEEAAVAGAIAALGIVLSRGLGEGAIDTGRAQRGDVIASDVR